MTIVSRRLSNSRGLFACTVVMEPAWPVFMAWSMSNVSAPRHSPTMIRSGRIRSEFRTRSRIRTSPVPSALACRVSSVTTWTPWSWSSADSSMVMRRSPSGMKFESTLSIVVFPVPVPPTTIIEILPRTHASRKTAASMDTEPREMRSCMTSARSGNFRMVSTGPRMARGGTIALIRDPSARRASTIGEDSSTRRPTAATMRSMMRRYWCSELNAISLFSMRPWRSIQISFQLLHMISVMVPSESRASRGP